MSSLSDATFQAVSQLDHLFDEQRMRKALQEDLRAYQAYKQCEIEEAVAEDEELGRG